MYVVVSGTKDAIMMVEAEANEVPEAVMLEAIMFGHDEIKKIVATIEAACMHLQASQRWKLSFMQSMHK